MSTLLDILQAPRRALWGATADVLGTTAPDSGAELLGRMGMDPENFLTKALGLGVEVLTDPVAWLGGALGGGLAKGLMGKAVAPVAEAAGEAAPTLGKLAAIAEESPGMLGATKAAGSIAPEIAEAAPAIEGNLAANAAKSPKIPGSYFQNKGAWADEWEAELAADAAKQAAEKAAAAAPVLPPAAVPPMMGRFPYPDDIGHIVQRFYGIPGGDNPLLTMLQKRGALNFTPPTNLPPPNLNWNRGGFGGLG